MINEESIDEFHYLMLGSYLGSLTIVMVTECVSSADEAVSVQCLTYTQCTILTLTF